MRNASWTMALLLSAICLALLGCGLGDPTGTSGKVGKAFITNRAPIEFLFPAGWRPNPDDHPFDLQCVSAWEDMNTGVFVFKSEEDLAADSTPIDIFRKQIDDLKSKRDNFTELEALQKHEYEDKTVTSVTYSGETNSSRNCYTFSLIEFRPTSPTFAIALQIALHEDRQASKPVFESIVRSARLLPESN